MAMENKGLNMVWVALTIAVISLFCNYLLLKVIRSFQEDYNHLHVKTRHIEDTNFQSMVDNTKHTNVRCDALAKKIEELRIEVMNLPGHNYMKLVDSKVTELLKGLEAKQIKQKPLVKTTKKKKK